MMRPLSDGVGRQLSSFLVTLNQAPNVLQAVGDLFCPSEGAGQRRGLGERLTHGWRTRVARRALVAGALATRRRGREEARS